MKKQLQLVLFVLFLTRLTGYGQSVGETFDIGDFKYEITSISPDNKVSLIDFADETATEVTIPRTVNYDGNEYKVTAIGDEAFYSRYTDTQKRRSLTKVTFDLPSNVTSIEEDAFYKNQLTEIDIPESVTTLGQRAFGTNDLTEVTIPNSLKIIPQWAFAANKPLTEVTIPASVESIEFQVFHGTSLQLVTLETSDPPMLHEKAFTSTAYLDGNRHDITLVVPKGAIGAYEVPTNGWTGFKLITNGFFTDDDINYAIISLTEVQIMGYSGSAVEMEISGTIKYDNETYTVTTIGGGSFRGKRLTKVTIPNTVTNIEGWAFAENELTEVIIPNSVTSIGETVFGQNKLTEVTIPDDVTSIGWQAFALNQLTEVIIPGNVTNIGSLAFDRNPELNTLFVAATTPPSIAGDTFTDRSQIDVIVPMGTKQAYLANGWDGFKSITEEVQVLLSAGSHNESNDFTLYPNPASDQVHIDLGSGQTLKQVNIYTMTGTLLYSKNGPEINTSRLSKSMYLFEIVTQAGARSMKKVIIR